MKYLWARMNRRDERGAVLVLAAAGLTLSLVAAALSVDLGRLAVEKRSDQKIADLAALDAMQDFTNMVTAARASAARNGFVHNGSTHLVDAVEGSIVNGNCVASSGVGSVCVTVTSPHENEFIPGNRTVKARAVAQKRDIAGFTLGSSLATVNTSSSALLNPILSAWLGGTVNLSVLSYQGLAAGHVTLEALRAQLASMGIAAGTVDQMLTSNITLAQLYQASAQALAANGQTANANLFNALRLQATSSVLFKLGEMVTIGQGGSDAAASAQLNLLQLLTGSATVANGQNLINVPGVSIAVPNAGSVDLSLRVIEGPKIYVGPAGTGPHVTTGQISLTITPHISVLNLLGLVKLTGDAPIELVAAGATGTLKSISCPSKNIVVTADPVAISASTKTTTLSVKTLANISLLDVNVSAVRAAIDEPATDVPFTYDAEFFPPNRVSKPAGSTMVGLEALTNTSGVAANVNLLGLTLLNLQENVVTATVTNLVDTLIGDIDELIVTPLITALGLDIGAADVTALGRDPVTGVGLPQCGLPTLVG